MNYLDVLQIIITILTAFTLIILLWQTIVQNRLAKGQILMLLHERYLKINEPGRLDNAVQLAKIYPEDNFNKKVYDKYYKSRPSSLRKYLYFAHVYEYFYFAHKLEVDKILPVNVATLAWIKEISAEKEFLDVQEFYKDQFPEFSKYLNKIISSEKK